MPFDVLDIIYHRSSLSMMSIRRTFVEILEPEDANRRGGSCPPNISGTRMAAKALLDISHKMKAPLIHEKAIGHNEEEALVESHGDEIKVWTESQDENRAKALPPFPVFRHKGIGCSEAPKLKERKKSSRHNDYYYYEAPIGSAGKPEHTGRKKENLKRAELRRRKKMILEREEMRKIKFGRVQSNACNQFVIESKLLI